MGVRVPHRLGLAALVPLGVQAPLGGDGVDDLPVGGGVPTPAEARLQVPRGAGGAGTDDEADSGLIQGVQVGGREHAGVSDYDQGLDLGGLAELFNDTDNRGGLSPVALPATNSQGEAGPVDQQPDDDLRVNPPLLGVTDLAQVVLTLGLEVQGGDACRHRARPLVAVT